MATPDKAAIIDAIARQRPEMAGIDFGPMDRDALLALAASLGVTFPSRSGWTDSIDEVAELRKELAETRAERDRLANVRTRPTGDTGSVTRIEAHPAHPPVQDADLVKGKPNWFYRLMKGSGWLPGADKEGENS